MKKIFLFTVIGMMMISCKKINTAKEEKLVDNKEVFEMDKDEEGCIASAGYRWSILMNKCIRVFEEGFRLDPVGQEAKGDYISNAFVIFEENKAELYIPEQKTSIILERKAEGKPYVNNDWSLTSLKGYVLKKGKEIKYIAAEVVLKKQIGNDKSED